MLGCGLNSVLRVLGLTYSVKCDIIESDYNGINRPLD